MKRPTSRNSPQTRSSSSLVHLPFPAHEVNLFNPPKSNPNGNLDSSLILNASLEDDLETPQLDNSGESILKQPWWHNLFTPWSISAIVIILLTNVVSGTLILLQSHWSNYSTATDSLSNEKVPPIKGPNLAESEFIELNLSTLSTIPYHRPTSSAKKNKIALAKSPSTSIPPVALSGEINNNYFYVFTEYTGDRSLALAREKVKNVSLINFPQGVFIYMGAFLERNDANQFVTQLQRDGIDAYVYPQD